MKRCPTCNSPSPSRHPAMQHEGEVQPCEDLYHKEDLIRHRLKNQGVELTRGAMQRDNPTVWVNPAPNAAQGAHAVGLTMTAVSSGYWHTSPVIVFVSVNGEYYLYVNGVHHELPQGLFTLIHFDDVEKLIISLGHDIHDLRKTNNMEIDGPIPQTLRELFQLTQVEELKPLL